MDLIQSFDSKALLWIQDNMNNEVIDKLAMIITKYGNYTMILISILIIIFLKKYRIVGYLTLIALTLNLLLGDTILKDVIQRPRPYDVLEGLDIIIKKSTSYSFPSGHASMAFAIVGTMSYFFKKYRVYLYTIATLIALSRIYLLVHYPTDVLVGILLGLFSSFIVVSLYNGYEKNINKNNEGVKI